MRLLSPAKLNLFLQVLSKRPDGYHEIQTLFERISLCDEIILKRISRGIRVDCSFAGSRPTVPKNLAYQAAKILKDEFQIKNGVEIQIKKRIPIGAGLGGGSSNAATVLLGLNHLWGLNLSTKKLMKLGAKIGSDVPFFILETSFALGEGRGEILKKVNAPGLKIWHCLVKPPFGISTKAAYENLETVKLTPKKTDVRMLLHSIQRGPSKPLAKLLTNSLEAALNKRVRTIHGLKEALKEQGALGALMSGSGSTVFGIYASERKARKAAASLKKKNKSWQVFVASTW